MPPAAAEQRGSKCEGLVVISPAPNYSINNIVTTQTSDMEFGLICVFSGMKLHCISLPMQASFKLAACCSSGKQTPPRLTGAAPMILLTTHLLLIVCAAGAAALRPQWQSPLATSTWLHISAALPLRNSASSAFLKARCKRALVLHIATLDTASERPRT